jgi:mevalonate kinase
MDTGPNRGRPEAAQEGIDMNGKQEIFYAKIMLFGEYSVICDSMGLTIPYAHFTGELSFMSGDQYTELDFAEDSNKHLNDYYYYLKDLESSGQMDYPFDLTRLRKDIEKGLFFESSIPQGYGIGSSGALVAAIYSQYAQNGITRKKILTSSDISRLKEIFAQMESYFHGVSSGIDPLLCYIKYPLLIRNRKEIETVGIPRKNFKKDGAVFLLDTGRPGKTGPLVRNFFDRCKNDKFMKLVQEEFIPANDGCITALLNGRTRDFFTNVDHLSEFQLKHLQEMIPSDFNRIWEEGLSNKRYSLKLCGSGGGGFLMGITKNYTDAKAYLESIGIEPILVYRNR